jgi:maltose O-acetyltransferase
MRNKIIYFLYLSLNIKFLGVIFSKINFTRAKILNLLPNFYIQENVQIYRNVRISRRSNIKIGSNTVIKENCVIGGNITIGNNVQILSNSRLDGTGTLIIGDNTHIGRDNDIFSHYHDIRKKDILVNNSKEIFQDTVIGDNVMLFSKVGIMGGVTISNNVVIAYGSVVTKDCQEAMIYAGIPAKKIGERV